MAVETKCFYGLTCNFRFKEIIAAVVKNLASRQASLEVILWVIPTFLGFHNYSDILGFPNFFLTFWGFQNGRILKDWTIVIKVTDFLKLAWRRQTILWSSYNCLPIVMVLKTCKFFLTKLIIKKSVSHTAIHKSKVQILKL